MSGNAGTKAAKAAGRAYDVSRASARNADGLPVDMLGPTARSFCVVGACTRALGGTVLSRAVLDARSPACRAVARAADETGPYWPNTFNDLETTTHADVLAAFDRAIEAAA